MNRMALLGAAALLGAGLGIPAAALAATVTLGASLSGPNETSPGDPDGTGSFVAEIDADAGDFCYTLKAARIGKFMAAHIHSGAAGSDGPPVVTISLDEDNCIAAEPDVLRPIVAAPGDFYVNVHTDEFPKGAVRGQLAAQ